MSGLVGGVRSNSGVIGGTISGDVTFENQPICVYAGWNTAISAANPGGSWINYPLDLTYKAVNTTYMTKSSNSFTVVKAGSYLVNLTCMSHLSDPDYTHHMVEKNGTWFHATHSYGPHSSDKWTDYSYSVIIDLAVSNTIAFKAYTNSGHYLWHDGASYSQVNIIFLHS